jgi:hypothetical protein
MTDRDLRADPATLTDNELWAAIYRLQGRNGKGQHRDRIRALVAEQQARRAKGAR